MEVASTDTTHPRLAEDRLEAAEAAAGRSTEVAIRLVDAIAAGVLLVVLAPLLAVIAIAIRLDSPGSPLFRQRRCGRGFREFTVLKFRTMRCDAAAEPHRTYVAAAIRRNGGSPAPPRPEPGDGLQKLRDDPRVTRVGVFLRRFSLDELPQLWNVLRGEMTLVGPRPPIPYEVELYPPRWSVRLSVKPGLTGLWQVSGRNELGYAEMVELDLEYVRDRSLWLNARIVARTFRVVLTGRGAV